MKISREVGPEDLFTVAGPGSGVRRLRINGLDAELTVTADDADELSAFFANLADWMMQDATS